jgi:hypothetical protein
MKRVTRTGDLSLGICSIGAKCCPHTWVSVHIKGSGNTYTNKRQTMRVGDIGVASCPHCPVSIATTGAPYSYSENKRIHRVGDIHIVPCGIGMVITASNDTLAE